MKDKNLFKKIVIYTGGVIFLLSTFYLLLSTIFAATNIDSTYRYAWNDLIGWIDFGYSAGNVNVVSTQLTGYASSSVGFIALDCATSPNGNICASSNFKVFNDGNGNLTGWAYNDNIGWISFSCQNETPSVCGSYPYYQVMINNSTGDFSGWAWNDIVGWISFNCNDSGAGGCINSNYKVKTSWTITPATAELTSSIFDTQSAGGVAINTIMWQGIQPLGTEVRFQIASSNNSAGPWDYKGRDGSNTTYYSPSGPNNPSQINLTYHNNYKYFRYKIFLYSNPAQTLGPRVDDVIINWSP